MPVLPLTCPIQHYEWGSRSSIPRLLGLSHPQEQPWAEQWMGAHPKAPSRLASGEPLADFIANNPKSTLGTTWAKQGKTTLPFLFKILAAEHPLSIQCHPSIQQAQIGFAAEEAVGIPLDAPNRNYRDTNHKPELIVALEELWALKGFRDPREIQSLFRRAGVRSAEPLLAALQDDGLRSFFSQFLALDEKQVRLLLTELATGIGHLPRAEARWTQGLLARYPRDPWAAACLILRLVRLDAGQALFLGSGELHSYLRGTGLEIMANSDNVLRGGLTSKHVAPNELMRVLRFEHAPAGILDAQDSGARATYDTTCDDFSLSLLSLEPGQEHECTTGQAEICLALGGRVRLTWHGGSAELTMGQAAFITADTKKLRVQNLGKTPTQLWFAGS